MPTTSNASLRYCILDRCFSNTHHQYTIDKLLEIVNEKLGDKEGSSISIRQLRKDIQDMRDRVMYDAPITAYPLEGRKCYYRYSDPDFSIFNNELSSEEIENLQTTIKMLGKYRGIPANAWIEEVISSLEYRFGIKANSENLISFEQNEQLKGLEFLSKIIDATINHQPLDIDYCTFKGNKIKMLIHPYYVKQYNGRWFLFSLDNHERIANIALDRIQHINNANVTFKKNNSINFDTYFNDIIGVTIPGEDVKKEPIILRFTKERFPYVVSKPIHQSQRIIEGDNYEVEIQVKPNRELYQQLFSFIPDVEIVSPQWLRNEITKKIKDNLKKYLSMQDDCIATI
ncbi:MAG: WYL domain-containing protein [Massilibacteroides sp.]|nr:WYL domain-containing protein [Massilibacteroides sp.]MDD3063496.1 WYL domain-containing protein [Massilibacteroides sp.]MDD4115904.1 WYL domain-containing protein [Massilibacteroides sp.]MDD4660883.1 WYL domain-containing protein [Massilibacteroides sp.]